MNLAPVVSAACASAVLGLLQLAGCSAAKSDGDHGNLIDDATALDDAPFDLAFGLDSLGEAPAPPCKGLQCKVEACAMGTPTSISGTVYAPNGTLPLYNVIAYVPNADLQPLTAGVTCDKCGAISSGDPIATALSDSKGRFKLTNVPSGSNIPLVFQVGKWRRKVVIPTVAPCTDNAISDANLTRLPKNQKEGDMPRIAVTTGGCDKLSCMLPKVGIDPAEFGGTVGGKQAVTFYAGGGYVPFFSGTGIPGKTPAQSLWGDLAALKKYDMAIFSCECSEAPDTKDAAAFKAVTDYLAQGGRIFTTDYQYTWYKQSPDPYLNAMGSIPGNAPPGESPIDLNTSFTKGKALADWLKFVDPTITYGKLTPDFTFDNFNAADDAKATTWASSGPVAHPRFITVNTPVGKPPETQCGKAVHLDAHINLNDVVDATFPNGCVSKINEGEEAFAFFFFDLASCIQKEGEPPKPPPPIK
ncbi:MAG: hypothetical protein NVS3B20_05550 [Polyangiales bacterium]